MTKVSIFLKSTCLLLAIFLKFIFYQKEKRGFNYLTQNIWFFISKHSIFYSKKYVFLENTCFWIFLKSAFMLLAIFLKFIFNQKEKRGFIWPKTSDFLFQINSIIYLEKELRLKNSCSWFFREYLITVTPASFMRNIKTQTRGVML